MSVAKRRRIKIIVRDETFYWQVQPHIPFDDYPILVVLSGDKRLNFGYPLSAYYHPAFFRRMVELGFQPPVPKTRTKPKDEKSGFGSMFEITPGFVRALIEWCLDNDCLTLPVGVPKRGEWVEIPWPHSSDDGGSAGP